MNQFRWGVLGVSGHFQAKIFLPVRQSPNNQIYAIASRDGKKAARTAEALGIPKWFGSYQELIDCPEVQGVYIPLPNTSHLEWIEKAAAAGKHIICEKPLTLTEGETARAFETARKHNVFLMEAFMFPFHPQWIRVREIIQTGEIGDLVSIQTQFAYSNRDSGNIRNILALGGGALRDIGCYGIASSQFVSRKMPRQVSAFIKRDPVFKTDVLTSCLLDYGDLHTSFIVSTQSWPGQNVKITGSRGSIEVLIPFNMYPDVPARLCIISGVGERVIKTEPTDQYARQFERFSQAVNEKDERFFHEKQEFSVGIQKIMDGLFESEKSGSWVTLK